MNFPPPTPHSPHLQPSLEIDRGFDRDNVYAKLFLSLVPAVLPGGSAAGLIKFLGQRREGEIERERAGR